MTASDALQGWWKIVSFHVETQDGEGRMSPYGDAPLGSVVFAGGRMSAILSSHETSEQEPGRFKTTMAYAGAYRVEDGRKLTVTVEAALFPAWIGTEQVRLFEVEGDALTLMSDWQETPMFVGRPARSVMAWRRV